MEKIWTEFSSDDVVNELCTIKDILRWTISSFSASNIWYGHGTNNPLDEAIHLIFPTLYLPLDLFEEMQNARLISSERYCIVKRVIRRINERIPVPYLTNKTWFCGYEFYVDERVLIPRSPIGELINQNFTGFLKKSPQRILDMCTGSACIAIACSYAFPEAKIDAVDLSLEALSVAEKNIKEHRLIHKVTPIHSNLFCNLPKLQYDMIITNPPYIKKDDIGNLPKEYRHEPTLGLVADRGGLGIIQRILSRSSDYLQEDGILICEVGNNMPYMIEKYPDVPFSWLKFSNGGDGVFILTREQLINVQNNFE